MSARRLSVRGGWAPKCLLGCLGSVAFALAVGCTAHFQHTIDARLRPEVASASLSVREISLRNAFIALQVTLAPPDVPHCELKAIRLQWMLNQAPFASSVHALSGPCLSSDHGKTAEISVESAISFLGLPTLEGPGAQMRLLNARVSVQGTLEVEVAGRQVDVVFGAVASQGQGVVVPQR